MHSTKELILLIYLFFVVKTFFKIILFLFVSLNVIIAIHAYTFTHFNEHAILKTKNPHDLSLFQKGKILFTGISLPKPINSSTPQLTYETIMLADSLEAWYIKSKQDKGTVLLFHGYGGCKSNLLGHSYILNKWGYNTMLVDFTGAGGSKGNNVTVGYKEAKTVRLCYDYIKEKNRNSKIILMGTSMGASAILKASAEENMVIDKIIIECPFGSMYDAVYNRFKVMNIPTFPFVNMLLFYGGVENGFWAYNHSPIAYAKKINVPVLLFYGDKDAYVRTDEIDNIFNNLNGHKIKHCIHGASHENYLNRYRKEWQEVTKIFLEKDFN